MIYSAKTTPRAFLALVEAGVAPGQVPPWITRPAPPPARPPSLPGAPPILPPAPAEPPKATPENPVPPVEPVETLSLEAKDQVPPGTLGAPGVGAYEALPGVGAGARLGARARQSKHPEIYYSKTRAYVSLPMNHVWTGAQGKAGI